MPGDPAFSILHLPVRWRAIAPLLGQLGIALAVLVAVPAAVALATDELTMAARFAAVIGVLGAVSLPLARLPHASSLQVNEGLAITAAIFMLPPLLIAWPLMAGGLDYADALFEAVSGITTTGLSTLAQVEARPQAFLFARAWLQWIGGLGITALVPLWLEPGPVARNLAGLDSQEGEVATSARHFARRILTAYLTVSIAAIALLWWLTGDAFTGVVHALAAVSTGGFSSYDDSLAGLGSPVVAVAVIAVSTLGAIPLLVYVRGAHGALKKVFADIQLRALLAFGTFAAVGVALLLVLEQGQAWPAAALNGFLLGFSAQTTTGFTPLDTGALADSIKLLLIFAMVTGGGLGSTAGGIKLLRMLVFLRVVQMLLQRTAMPRHAWFRPRLGELELDEGLVAQTLALVLLFTTAIMVSWLVFVMYDYDAMDSLFEVVSALATVGLSSGLTAPDLPALLKGVLCLDMWLGRLEIVAVLVLLNPLTWRPRRGYREAALTGD